MAGKIKKVMILGAGSNQLPAIQKAVNLGYYVITMDYLPDNIGHKYAHRYVNCSTVNKEGVLQWADELEIDGIMTMASDAAIPTVGFVAEKLSLPGADYTQSETFSDKSKFRDFQRIKELNSPKCIIGRRFEDVVKKLPSLKPPIMFKPADTSGSRGISRVNGAEGQQFINAFNNAMDYSRSMTVCVEEYLEGIDISGDGFLQDGEFAFGLITKKYKKEFVVTGHCLPTHISSADQDRVFSEVASVCRAAGYHNGPLDFDVRVDPGKITIIEMSPRLGGNGIPMIIERATGVDLITANILFAMGEKVLFPSRREIIRSCGSLIFGSDHGGILKHIATSEEMKKDIAEIFNYVVGCHIGDEVSPFVHGGNSIGYALFDCPYGKTYEYMVEVIKRRMSISVVKNRMLASTG